MFDQTVSQKIEIEETLLNRDQQNKCEEDFVQSSSKWRYKDGRLVQPSYGSFNDHLQAVQSDQDAGSTRFFIQFEYIITNWFILNQAHSVCMLNQDLLA